MSLKPYTREDYERIIADFVQLDEFEFQPFLSYYLENAYDKMAFLGALSRERVQNELLKLYPDHHSHLDYFIKGELSVIVRKANPWAYGEPSKAPDSVSKEETFLVWRSAPEKLVRLHAVLLENKLIGEINLAVFKEHFNGKNLNQLIDWHGEPRVLFELISQLKEHLDHRVQEEGECYIISRHFLFKGKNKKIKELYSLKSIWKDISVKESRKKLISLIIKSL